jgi:hypothetical protein
MYSRETGKHNYKQMRNGVTVTAIDPNSAKTNQSNDLIMKDKLCAVLRPR